MFYFRINKIKISENRENPAYSIFGTELKPLKLISFITTENSNLPDMSNFIQTSDFQQKKVLLKQAIETVVSSRIYSEIDHSTMNNTMSFGKPGYVLYKSNQIPNNFDWQFIAYENGQSIKESKQMLENIYNDKEFDNFTSNLTEIISKADNPSQTAAVSIAKYAINVTTNIARENNDGLLGISYTSLNRNHDYIYGGKKRERISDITNKMFIDYSIFGYDE
ncbi:MAG: hypothetical protein ACOYO1_15530 [Bacteroidales bacterium]